LSRYFYLGSENAGRYTLVGSSSIKLDAEIEELEAKIQEEVDLEVAQLVGNNTNQR